MILFCFFSCEKKQINYSIPTTYSFENVNYDGQYQRIEMLKEFISYAKSAATDVGSVSLSEANLLNMYQNLNAPFSNNSLNETSVQLKNKTKPELREDIEACIEALAASSQNINRAASVGFAGIMTDATTGDRYLFNENGVELAEILDKLIVSAVFYYQITVVYLGENKMNTDNKGAVEDRGTNMEHHWDEAFGYFGVSKDFPSNITALDFLGYYSNKTNSVLGYNSRIMNSFLQGRAAISAKDYPTRDLAREDLKTTFEVLMAATSISYLNDAKANTASLPNYYHYLSKAYATIMGLKHGASQTLSDTEIDDLLIKLGGSSDPLQTNFYSIPGQNINLVIDDLGDAFTDLTPIKNSL